MRIKQMFRLDINRKINGVVKVDQDEKDVLVQELNEYVITRELKKHFISFFNSYLDSFEGNNADIGVWISGFFGSGKSHFLKMLSYLLENEEVDGIKTVERFREKFDNDPATFMLIDKATRNKTDTILFNIDIEGSSNKDNTAVLRVFAKMFYKFLGFYGEDLKVAKLEQYLAKRGKTEEFHRVFEERYGDSWINSRDAYAFLEDEVVATLQKVLDMSEQSARNWFNGSENVETSIAQLVSEIKEYVDSKPKDYRLLFMVDEVGQYVGGDTDLLLNLQSLVEKIGSECSGKVWIVCTGQEAIDEVIKARENEFSRIQARFATRLSLSSSSADEVIQKRILLKTDDAKSELEQVYNTNDSVLRNLFTFNNAILDIKGYSGSEDFVRNFPFVPYQFILMQKVFTEIRKHENSGTHFSGGERSMLSGFQDAAQKIEDKDEFALAPFYLFYDTVHSFLSSSIRRVIERCEKAAADGAGLEAQDVDVLKLLYLVRYVDDVKANLDNLVILMANDIRMDKISMREQVQSSLDRLLSQNYIGRTGDVYNFLTDEEQDIQREIKNTTVDSSDITSKVSSIVFGDIYTAKKFRYGKYDFDFDQMVDNTPYGKLTGGMKLHIITVAMDPTEKQEMRLLASSEGQVIVVLAQNQYYEYLESALKISKYVKQRNVTQLPQSIQAIIRGHQDTALKYEKIVEEYLKKAIIDAEFYIAGERKEITGGDAKNKIDQALEYLVSHVYSELGLITKNYDTDADIRSILKGSGGLVPGMEPNRDAAAKIETYLEMQYERHLTTSMAEIQNRYQAIPYGWKEIDIAAVVALLIHDQKVTVKYGGETIQSDNPRLPDMLRKRTEIGKTAISKRDVVSGQKIREVREFLRDYFDEMDVPEDEDGLISHIVDKFSDELAHYEDLLRNYAGHRYPDKPLVENAVRLVKEILSQKKDNLALINRVISCKDELYSIKDSLRNVEAFFKNQVNLFDAAVEYVKEISDDSDYIAKDSETNRCLNEIKSIITTPEAGNYDYAKIPDLNGLMSKVKEAHSGMLEEKCVYLESIAKECMGAINAAAGDNPQCISVYDEANGFYNSKKQQISEKKKIVQLDSLVQQMWNYKDSALERIDSFTNPSVETNPESGKVKAEPKKLIKSVSRMVMFPGKTLSSDEEIDDYVETVRNNLKKQLKDCDGIKLN